MQLEGVRRTLVNCYEHIPFYKRSFDEAGFDPYHLASLDDLANAPFVTKQDLRDAAPYGMLAVPLSDVREVHMSSGTTGVATLGASLRAVAPTMWCRLPTATASSRVALVPTTAPLPREQR